MASISTETLQYAVEKLSILKEELQRAGYTSEQIHMIFQTATKAIVEGVL